MIKKKVPFVIVGGAALALHGIPRSTLDIDLVVPSDSGTFRDLFSVAHQTGLRCSQAEITRLADKPALLLGQWVTFHDRSGREILDLFFEDWVTFSGLSRRAVRRRTKDGVLAVASLGDLIRMKRESGRAIDLADIALIQERLKQERPKMKRRA